MSTAPKTSAISVIIPARNEAAHLPLTLTAVLREPVREVLVVDGGSSDTTASLAAERGCRVLSSPPGRGNQLNLGAAKARGELLFFLHADTLPPAGFAGMITAILAEPDVLLGAFPLRIDGKGVGLRIVEAGANLRAHLFKLPYGDQGLFLRRDDFFRLGGFPEIPIMEDVSLVRRVRRHGQIVLAREPVVTSPRRWRRLGLLRTTCLNQLFLLGFLLGIPAERIAAWYRQGEK